MTWLISKALMEAYENSLSLPGQEVESSGESCSDGEPSAPSNGNPIPRAYFPAARMTDFSRLSRFGMTFGPLTDDRGEALLTWFLEDSRARTSALQAKVPESMASEAECGPTWRELWAKYDPVSCSWRTLQHSLLGDSEELSPTWPRSGMTADGQCWALPMSGLRTEGTDSGLSEFPTPNVIGYRSDGELAILARTITDHQEYLQMTSRAAKSKRERWWPTQTVCGNYNRKGASATSGDGLATAVRMWPTPTTNDSHNWTMPPSQIKHDNIPGEMLRRGEGVPGGTLNPTWVEWLMGFPLGWTALKPLAMDKSHCALQQHGDC